MHSDSIVTATPNVVGTNVFQSENQIALNCASSSSQTIADCKLDVAMEMETDIRQCNAEVGCGLYIYNFIFNCFNFTLCFAYLPVL